jgi:hypothetical protein
VDIKELKKTIFSKPEEKPKPKRVLIVEQAQNDTFGCSYQGLDSRQQLLPMLRAAEKQFRINLNRKAITMSNASGKLIAQ